MTRSSVVLPQPEGPSSATSSPGAIVRSIAVEDRLVAEALADAGDLDALAGGARRRRPRGGHRAAWRAIPLSLRHSSQDLKPRVTKARKARREASEKAPATSYSL